MGNADKLPTGNQKGVIMESRTNRERRQPLAQYLTELDGLPLLSKQQEAELSERWLKHGDASARNQLVERNLGLVLWTARQFTWSGLDIADLVQEGNLGLMKAADRYDHRVGRFPSYASHWIRSTIRKYAQDHSATAIRFPVSFQTLKRWLLRTKRELIIQNGVAPSNGEIATHLGITEDRVRDAFATVHLGAVSLDDSVHGAQGSDGKPVTFQALVENLNSFQPDVCLLAVEELYAAKARIAEALDAVAAVLQRSPRDLSIFRQFYDLDGLGERRTLAVVAEMQTPRMTRERVRQIIARTWKQVSTRGVLMNHNLFLAEQARMEALEEFVDAIIN
jgi:RNA polymerase primary sigma factor